MSRGLAGEYFRIGDRVVLTDTKGSSFDFIAARLAEWVSEGIIIQLPDNDMTADAVIVRFDGLDAEIAVLKRRLLLQNPLERLAREI
jgi:hypothetical protein